MPSATLAINKCSWLSQGSMVPCGKNSFGKFCGFHNFSARTGTPNGPQPCIGCGRGVRGKYKICVYCGGCKYRSLLSYNKRKNIPSPSPEEFIRLHKPPLEMQSISHT